MGLLSSTALLLFLLLTKTGLQSTEGTTTTTMAALDGCTGTPDSLLAAVNASAQNNLTRLVINCLSYSDNRSTVNFGSLSFQEADGTRGRYSIECSNGLLLLSLSTHSFRDEVSYCYECEDMDDPCVTGTECEQDCQLCLQSECLSCIYRRYNGRCLNASTDCPNGGTPNPANGNECECRPNFGGSRCDECQLMESDCENTYRFRESQCDCVACQGGVQVLLDPYSQVPDSVIGTPGTTPGTTPGEGEHHSKRTTEGSHGESERTVCREACPNGWETANSGICYACGLEYCLQCHQSEQCEKCRNGTLLNHEYHCEGFYTVIRELSEELEHEEEHEREVLAEEQLHLKIALPVVCFVMVLLFVLLGVFAHFRYPHVGHEKRHRDPNKKKVIEDTIENRFRPQSTVRFR